MPSVWEESGKSKEYQHVHAIPQRAEFRAWLDDGYYARGLSKYLDKNFLDELRNNDFYARVWELALCRKLFDAGLSLIPTNSVGPDFCIEIGPGRLLWIEAVHAAPTKAMARDWLNYISSGGGMREYGTEIDDAALRYSGGSLNVLVQALKFSPHRLAAIRTIRGLKI